MALPYIDISMSTPSIDEVTVACPIGCNNNNARGWVIYVRVVTYPGGGTTHACASSWSKLTVRINVIHHHLQDVAPSQMLQSGWCRSCLLPSAYRPRHHVLSGQSSSRSSFFSFFLFLVGHNSSVYLSARKKDVRTMHFFTTRTTSTLTSATSALRGYHIHVVLIGFYYSHNIRVITTLQLQGDVSSSDSTFDLFSGITVCGAPAVIAWGVLEYIS
jgi:hypothetical protein